VKPREEALLPGALTSDTSGARAERATEVSGHPPANQPKHVRDDDGHVHTFDRERIASSVRRAQAEVGDDDVGFASEVAAIVSLALARGDAQAVSHGARGSMGGRGPARGAAQVVDGTVGEVAQEFVGDLVERALIELGRAPVARAFIVARARRRAAREALRAEPPTRAKGVRLPDVRGAAGTAPWNPARIVAALVEEAGLPRERALEVAERVEGRVAGAGLRRLSTGLVRELVSNELLALGLDRALRAHEALGVPRYDLRRLFTDARARRPGASAFGGPTANWSPLQSGQGPVGQGADPAAGGEPAPPGFEERVAGEVLRRHALEDVVGEAAAERHRTGDHHLVDIERPHRVLWRALPAELLLRREPSASAAHEVALDAATLASECGHGLVLEELATVVAPALRTARSDAALRDVLLALAAGAEGARRRIDLSRPAGRGATGARGGVFVARLITTLAGLLADGLAAPRLFLTFEELEAAEGEAALPDGELTRAVERLLAAGRLVPVWHGTDGAFAAPGCVRRAKDRAPLALGAAVALNLPRLARRAGPWREESLLTLVADAARAGIEGLVALDQHQREARSIHGEPVRERVTHGIVPVGLDEALRILGDGAVRPAQGARVLGLLADAAARFSEAQGLAVRVTALPLGEVSARFAALDALEKRAQQPRLFSDLPRPEDERNSRYSIGYDVPSLVPAHAGALGDASFGAELAELLATLPSGALLPFLPRAGAPFGRITAWRAFEERRRSLATGPEGVRLGTL
jgi:hypothetical protein